MPYVENDGVRIHYEVEGKGPSLVLQHGFTHSLRRWYLHGYVDALRNDYELVLIDARGHGESDKPHDPHAYSLAARVRDVVAVVDDLKRRAVMFWGWSAGGRIGFGLAQYAPQRITAFVIGGGHPYERRLPESSRIAGADPEAFLTAFFKRLKIDPATVPSVVREELMKNDFRALAAARHGLATRRARLLVLEHHSARDAGLLTQRTRQVLWRLRHGQTGTSRPSGPANCSASTRSTSANSRASARCGRSRRATSRARTAWPESCPSSRPPP